MPCDTTIESELFAAGRRLIAGADEVGRGAVAGPVVAAAVIDPRRSDKGWLHALLALLGGALAAASTARYLFG